MSDTVSPAPYRLHWRCRRCGTPNPWRPDQAGCLGCGAAWETPEGPGPFRSRLWVRGVSWASYGYAALILLVLAAIRWVGDGWWGVVVLLFTPRWLFLVPVLALACAGLGARRPSLWAVQGATALVIAGPLMGFSLPLPRLSEPKREGDRFRIMTYNQGQGRLDAPRLIDMIERERVDLVCFQEGHYIDPLLEGYFSKGWYRDRARRVASRYPIVRDLGLAPMPWDTQERYGTILARVRLRAPSGAEFVLASVHLPTLRPGLNRFLGRDVAGLELHIDWWRRQLDRAVADLTAPGGVPVLAAGDFNMPPDDSTLAALRSRFRFAFEESGWGYGYTRPTSAPFFRIDHIMASPHWQFRRCWVGPDFGSDHLPLLADVVLPSAAPAPGRGAR